MGVAGSALSKGGTDGKRENPDNLYFRAGAIQMAAVATFVAMHTHSPASALMHFGIGMLDADAIMKMSDAQRGQAVADGRIKFRLSTVGESS